MKEIVQISIPTARLRQRVKQANGNAFSRRVVFPANVPKFGSHILLISEDFIRQDPTNEESVVLSFYADRDVHLSKRVVLNSGEVVYPLVKTTPMELKDAVALKIPQLKKEEMSKEEFEKKVNHLKTSISAIDYLKDIYGFTFRGSNKFFKCDQHPSLVVDVSKNAIHWNSENIHGSLIQFIEGKDGKDFKAAIMDMQQYYDGLPVDKQSYTPPAFVEKEFTLPEKVPGTARIKDYLCNKRAIDEILVDRLIKEDRLYQDDKGNCVFVMENANKEKVGAFKRSTYSDFRGDAQGSKKTHGMFLELCPGANKLVITEAFIDGLSYATLKKLNNEKIDYNILCSDSASTINETFRVNYLTRPELNKNVDTIIMAPDDDKAGKNAIESFKEFVKPFHYIEEVQVEVPEMNDWNNDLVSRKECDMELKM